MKPPPEPCSEHATCTPSACRNDSHTCKMFILIEWILGAAWLNPVTVILAVAGATYGALHWKEF